MIGPNMKKNLRILLIALLCCLSFTLATACNSGTEEGASDSGTGSGNDGGPADEGLCDGDDSSTIRPEGWGALSHCSHVDPDYDKLFADDVVHRFDITISPEDYQATMDDLAEKLSGGGPGGPPGGGDTNEDPIFVPVTLEFEGLTWSYVAMRYKGNSSLRSAYQSGTRKLAIRLNFELYETLYPEIKNQRFYGFEKMTFSNAFKDPSLIRDKTAADIFREQGVPVARSAFARIYVDFGEGPVYFGLYTMIEDPSNRMLDTQFNDDSGNLYKPESEGAKWTDRNLVEAHFDKKTNWEQADFSDVLAAFDALHADRDDAKTWRTGLETTFNVAGFLKCLAINQTIVNWDSYGFMSHNYYVYSDPSNNGRLTWFPWDLNEAMIDPPKQDMNAGSVMLDEITDEWPMIRYLLDDDEYRQTYKDELEAVLEGSFAIDKVHAKMQAYHDLIAPYVTGPESVEESPYTFLKNSEEFNTSLTTGTDALKPHVESRHQAVKDALGL
ncbi:MAG: hypothetical protein GY854_32005 [Deltaproteobacteria bacterium]|nr:hypothetical protein [Deltaproteobacteria bacterium]